MRTLSTLFLFCWLCSACGDDDDETADIPDAAADAARPDDPADASDGADAAPPAEIVALLQEAIDAYDSQIEPVCPCLVEAGAYPSEEECLALLASGPTWVECSASVLAEHDSPRRRVEVACYIEQWTSRGECLSAAACDPDATAACDQGRTACGEGADQLALLLLERCPDLGLLSRL